jgi:ATP-binding cassette subfamily B protein
LTRLFDPTEGEILINDVNIKEYNPEDLYEKMSVLFQDYRISHRGTSFLTIGKFVPLRVSENISTGDIENRDLSAIKTAAEDAGADPFIEKLPHQYDTKLRDTHGIMHPGRGRRSGFRRRMLRVSQLQAGVTEEDDPNAPVDLSGGQWQRLALSRAFMRASSADLLILDEPSSSLDPEAEHNLFRFIQQVRRNKTTIYVTHRFYTVRLATKIAFLEDGKLIEWGRHNELMAIEGGKYAKLYQLQSEGFSSLGQAEEAE